jgi:hypothetical protein
MIPDGMSSVAMLNPSAIARNAGTVPMGMVAIVD